MIRVLAGASAVLVVSSMVLGVAQSRPPAPVDDAALRAAESRNQDWLSYGRDYYEQRFSPLDRSTTATSPSSAWPGSSRPPPTAASRRRRSSSTA